MSELPKRRTLQSSDDPSVETKRAAVPFPRRDFFGRVGTLVSAMAFARVLGFLEDEGWLESAQAADHDLVLETLNGLVAFIVPGPDTFSLAQGVSTPEPGGIDAGVLEVLVESINQSQPFFPLPASALVATTLNNLASLVNPAPSGPFGAPFANLSFAEKVQVFAIMDGTDPLKQLAGILPFTVAFLAYSEAGVFDPATRTLTGSPVGWVLAGYEGVSDGRDEFVGYFQNRKKVKKEERV